MNYDFTPYRDKINHSEQVLVIYGTQATFPAVAVATSLYLWLRSQGKKVKLLCSRSPVVEFSHLVGINKVKGHLQGENLVIRLPLPASQIDKVVSDMNAEADELSLIVKPKKNAPTLEIEQLDVSYQIPDYDLIFYIDVREISELQALTSEKQEFWRDGARNICLNDYANPTPVPSDLNETLSKDIGYVTFWASLWHSAQVRLDSDQASNLLMGLDQETKGFASDFSSAESFELAAWLMRCGGRRYVPDERAQADFHPENHLPQVIDFKKKR